MSREYVPIFFDWPEITSELNAEEKGRLIDAVVIYAQGGDPAGIIQGNERFLFPAFKRQIDRAAEYSDSKSKAATEREQHKKAQKAQESTSDHKEAQKAQESTKAPEDEEIQITNNNEDEKEELREHPPEGGKKNGAARRTKAAPSGITLARFEAFWSAYPRKQDKAKALRAFERLDPDTDLLAVIMSALEEQKASPQWRESGGQYIPMASTWLNGRRWEDEPTGAAKGPVTAARYQQRSYTEAELAALQDDPVLRALEGTA